MAIKEIMFSACIIILQLQIKRESIKKEIVVMATTAERKDLTKIPIKLAKTFNYLSVYKIKKPTKIKQNKNTNK